MEYLDEMLAARLVQETQALAPQLAEWRRHLHQNPEVGFGTADTEAFVRAKLSEAGIELLDARLGVLGVIRAPHADGMVGLRGFWKPYLQGAREAARAIPHLKKPKFRLRNMPCYLLIEAWLFAGAFRYIGYRAARALKWK